MSQTEGQISLFDYMDEETTNVSSDGYEAVKAKVAGRLVQIVDEKKLPLNGLLVRDNNGETIISFSVCTNEPDFPCPPEQIGKIATLTSMVKVQLASTRKDEGKIWIDLTENEFNNNIPPKTAEIRDLTTGTASKRVVFSASDSELIEYIIHMTLYNLKSYRSKTKTFACCSRFNDCSDAKECVHSNKLYSTVCQYRQNLEAGKIFYGKNRNVETSL